MQVFGLSAEVGRRRCRSWGKFTIFGFGKCRSWGKFTSKLAGAEVGQSSQVLAQVLKLGKVYKVASAEVGPSVEGATVG